MAQIIKSTGAIKDVEPANEVSFSLEEMQKIVGGNIEVVRIKNGKLMIVNEEGKLHGLRFNSLATSMTDALITGDYIVGDVLICEQGQIE